MHHMHDMQDFAYLWKFLVHHIGQLKAIRSCIVDELCSVGFINLDHFFCGCVKLTPQSFNPAIKSAPVYGLLAEKIAFIKNNNGEKPKVTRQRLFLLTTYSA
jgi:hypothetical protein